MSIRRTTDHMKDIVSGQQHCRGFSVPLHSKDGSSAQKFLMMLYIFVFVTVELGCLDKLRLGELRFYLHGKHCIQVSLHR